MKHENIADIYKLTPIQQGMLFHSLYTPESGVYFEQFSWILDVELNVPVFERAWEYVIDQHPILRTSFFWEALDEPLQVVQRQAVLPFTELDWSDLPLKEQEVQLETYLQVDRQRPFDLTEAPLMRVAIARGGPSMFYIVWSYHHLLLDGWSVPLVLQDVFAVYSALVAGQKPRLARRRPYRDYLSWLRKQDLEKAESYWRQMLTGINAATPLPVDRAPGSIATSADQFRKIQIALSPEVTETIQALARQERLTTNTLVQGAWALLLHRYSGQNDLVFGATVSGRPADLAGSETMVGCFINTLPVRVQIRSDLTFREWLQALQSQQVELRQYEYSPLVQVQNWSDVPRGEPLFESIVVFENYPSEAFGQSHDLRIFQKTNYPLTLVAVPQPTLTLRIGYETHRFEETTISRLLEQLQIILESMAEQMDRPVTDVDVLAPAERQLLLVDWNATTVAYPRDVCLHTLIERQVERTPEATALVFEDTSLTYAALNARANQLAHHLRALGVEAETRVAVCLERSLELVIALVGVLKAGAAYVPIDPGYPSDRIQFMLADAAAPVLLTQEHVESILPPHTARVLRLDADWPTIAQQPTSNPALRTDATNLAYLIYTSGSTGQPKGALNTHQAIVNRLLWMQDAFQLNPTDRVLQKTPFSFDVSVWEFFWPLLTGATLVVARPGGHQDSAYLVDLIARERITTLHFVPSMLQVFLEEPQLDRCQSLRRVICSGEALPLALQERFFTRLSAELHNLYGPTEAAVDVTWWPCQPTARLHTVPIGRPIANTQIYLLDSNLQPVPVGVPGELHIGGVQLARGYLNRPALTAEKFIPDPFSPSPNARLYKTGDLARYLPDGAIEYLGRLDFQVKVRGFRIELGEIETALGQHPQLREVVVLARQDAPGETRLVAYLVPQGEAAPTVGELRRFLEPKLPEYMLPAAFVTLDALPLSPNGKVDRKALPAPDSARPELDATYMAPTNDVEQALAEIWKQVLGVEQVGIHDNFFELGGDSILSFQIIARAAEAGMYLTPSQLFQHRTIAALSGFVNTKQRVEAEQGLVTGAVVLTPIQQWFFAQHFAQPQHWNQAVLLDLTQPLDPALLEQAVAHLVTHHDALRLRFSHDADGWHQTTAASEPHALVTHLDLAALPAGEQAAAVTAHASELQASLDLADGPLLRVATFDLGPQGTRLLIVVHHLAVDGVSWRVLVEDLHTVYQQLQAGATPTLPAKTTSFQHWAARLHEFAQSPALHAEAQTWLDRPWPQILSLPLDRNTGVEVNVESSARIASVTLSAEETRALLQDVPQAYNVQINDLLLTALAEAFARWTGERTILVDLEGHGREDLFADVDVSRTVGWFTSLFPVVLDVREAHGPDGMVKAVKEQLRQIPGRGIGYGLLRYLSDDPELRSRLAALPRAEVLFNYLGQLDQALPEGSPFALSGDNSGPVHSPRNRRTHLLEINGFVANGSLRLDWTYSEQHHDRATIERVAQDCLRALQSLIAYCLTTETRGYTPSDFPLAVVDQPQLDWISRERVIADLYPLASVQQGMLFHTLSAPTSGVYVQQLTCDLSGDLNVEAFRQAWQHVVDQHTILRTGFLWEHVAQPLQVVQPQAAIPFTQLDWREHSAAEQEQQFEAYLRADREQGFDLLTPPLLRLALIQTGDTAYRFLWSYHHIVLDGWSMPLIFRQVLTAYHAFSNRREAQIEASRPYRDYIDWLQRQDLAAAEAFWRSTLAGFDAPTPLTVDRPFGGESGAESAYGEQTLTLSKATTEALQTLARQHHLTINTLVQGAWALLLHRYSGERDIVFGAATSGRPPELTGSETMIGLFINTLPVRVEATPEAGLIPWLQQLQARQVEMRQFEFTPLAQIQSWSSIPRGQSLFESILVFENYPMDELLQEQQGSLQFGLPHTIEQTNYPLTIVAIQEPAIQFTMSYDTRRFDDATIARVQQHLHTLLESMIAGAAQALDELVVMSETERRQILMDWNATTVDYPEAVCLHTLIEQQVERTPETTALVFEDASLTYAELNARANQLAHHLRSLGVGAETRVAVCMERSLELVIALVGVLKAGAAYVPVDPEYPKSRVGFMLADAQAPVLLTQQHLLDTLPRHEATVLCVDTAWPQIAQQPTSNPALRTDATNLAYMIYTSGSTGQPKGALNTHQAIVNRLVWMQDAFQLDATDRVLQKTPFSFDVSVWEFFWPLLTGATLVVARPGGQQDSAYLVDLIARERITTLHFVPSMLQVFLEEPQLDRCQSLRRVICSGEALPLALQERFFTRLSAELHNLYGPTEAAVDVTWWPCQPTARLHTVPIGRPIANTQIYLLDSNLRPVPVGVPGELHIGGVQLARGYLGRPALTAERFIPDPFSPSPNARLYTTGDLARFLPDGAIEYLGRLDFQVKVRGFRIELGEIETALGQHPQLREVVVLARQDAPGETRLVAYLVPQGEAAPTVGELRRFLEPKLPEYMIPAAFVTLDALPLSPNGKVDRRALPAPDTSRPELEAAFVPPQTPEEQALAEIWQLVLGLERVGVHDNFFALGGDSILSLQVVARANEAGLRLTPAQLFQHRTIAELAAVVGANQPIQAEQGLVTGDVALTPIQQWFFAQHFAQPQHWNQAVLLDLTQPLDPALLQPTVAHLVTHHDALRLRFTHDAGGWKQTTAASEDQPLVTHLDLAALSAGEQAAAVTAHASELQASLNLADGPLLRVATFDLGPQGTRLLIVVHHLAVDGVSWRVLVEDLHTVYQQFQAGATPTLPAKTTSFQHWAQRLEAFAQSSALRAEAQTWLDRPWPQIPSLPRDLSSGKNIESATRTVTVKLSSTLTHSLMHDAHQAYNTQINDLLLAALAETLADWTDSRTVLLNLEGHGREDLFPDVDVSRTVGWFTSLFPVVLDLRKAHQPGAVITSVKEQLRDLPNHGVGYGILRYLSQDAALREQLQRLPQGEIMFNYVGQLDQVLPATTPFRFAAEGSGPTHSPQAERAYLLEVNAAIAGGQLQVEWSYSDQIYDRATIETLAETYLDVLHELIEHALSPEAGAYTPSDFAEFEWSQDSLDNITDIIRKSIGDL